MTEEKNINPGPLVTRLDADLGDLSKNYQPHEKYRAMRSLAINLENQLNQLSMNSFVNDSVTLSSEELDFPPTPKFCIYEGYGTL